MDQHSTYTGSTFRNLREQRGLTLDAVLAATRQGRGPTPRGLSHGHIRQWERGGRDRNISSWAAHQLARAVSRLSGEPVTPADFATDPHATSDAA